LQRSKLRSWVAWEYAEVTPPAVTADRIVSDAILPDVRKWRSPRVRRRLSAGRHDRGNTFA